jgi:hypothetical protein
MEGARLLSIDFLASCALVDFVWDIPIAPSNGTFSVSEHTATHLVMSPLEFMRRLAALVLTCDAPAPELLARHQHE